MKVKELVELLSALPQSKKLRLREDGWSFSVDKMRIYQESSTEITILLAWDTGCDPAKTP